MAGQREWRSAASRRRRDRRCDPTVPAQFLIDCAVGSIMRQRLRRAAAVSAMSVDGATLHAPIPPKAPPSAAPVASAPKLDLGLLLLRGNAMLALGDISAARLLYERATALGSAERRPGLGTHTMLLPGIDPDEGIVADQAAAIAWYRKAAAWATLKRSPTQTIGDGTSRWMIYSCLLPLRLSSTPDNAGGGSHVSALRHRTTSPIIRSVRHSFPSGDGARRAHYDPTAGRHARGAPLVRPMYTRADSNDETIPAAPAGVTPSFWSGRRGLGAPTARSAHRVWGSQHAPASMLQRCSLSPVWLDSVASLNRPGARRRRRVKTGRRGAILFMADPDVREPVRWPRQPPCRASP